MTLTRDFDDPALTRRHGTGVIADTSRSDSPFARGFTALADLALTGARVSACVRDIDSGRTLLSFDEDLVMPTGSVGTLLLLIETAERVRRDRGAGLELVCRRSDDMSGQTGVWSHLGTPTLPLVDLAVLVGATDDSTATNALLRRIGLDAVAARTEALGLARTALLDRVRENRGPDDAPEVSVGCTGELAGLFAALARGEAVDPPTSRTVVGWLSLGSDLSMVAGAFGCDPHAHRYAGSHDVVVVNKTGAEPGTRTDAGILQGPRADVSYAVSVSFDDTFLGSRLAVLEAMRAVGFDLLEYVH